MFQNRRDVMTITKMLISATGTAAHESGTGKTRTSPDVIAFEMMPTSPRWPDSPLAELSSPGRSARALIRLRFQRACQRQVTLVHAARICFSPLWRVFFVGRPL